MSAIEDIAAERQRQQEVEGFGAGRDDEFIYGQLAKAAAAYAEFAARSDAERKASYGAPKLWPWWSLGEFKPVDRRRDLVRAGALIAAEIDRLDRAAP